MKIHPAVKLIKNKPLIEVNYAYHKTISYSQFATYYECPHKWELQYKDNLQQYEPSIHTVFGTAMHSAIQHYLTLMYNESGVAADKFDIETFFEDEFRKVYLKEYETNKNTHFSSATEMREFFDDGIAILNFLKKKRNGYFSKRGWHLIDCELPIVVPVNNTFTNILYKGYIDMVLYHEPNNIYKIYDFKTSTRGWNDDAKKDERKQFQLLFYKKYFSKLYDVPEDNIEVEFIILKRKIWEESEYPQSRIQEYIPPSGKIKMNKAINAIDNFLNECFNLDGTHKPVTHPINPNKNCQWCPFNERKDLCKK